MRRSAARPYKWRDAAATMLPLLILPPLTLPLGAHAADVARPAYTPPPAVDSSGIVQIILSLFLVLAAIVLVAWLLKRMNMAQQEAGRQLKVLGGVSIGQRERIVLVEVENTWLVVGVGPGQIRTLHTLPKIEGSAEGGEAQHPGFQTPGGKFATLLSSALGQRKQAAGNK